ncbi:hypothetical protein [Mariniblastus fucicola]|uniref:Uncharacterized protein n=1 Tax=Mariniblastus fucicola TaxID=980251 RepID=A0A5B9P828_9BACT|nr:hypothetical protein [Mariniblastus fucicola]QEG21020.1 hypothetical protein MFFC18_08720 [Mariniblastus fucicola]
MAKKETNQPVERFQLRGITASIFENKSDSGAVFHKVSIARTYKDGDQFKSTSVFSRDDLPVVEVLTKKSWIAILQRETKKDSE